jgi:DNA repair protein RadC
MLIRESVGKKINNAADVAKILRAILQTEDKIDRDKEHFWAIALDTQHKIKFIELVTLGTLSGSLVHPREVFRLAISEAVCSLIIGHNHPSGNLNPSKEDIAITKRLKESGEIIGIKLLDSIIINESGEHTSLKETGLM